MNAAVDRQLPLRDDQPTFCPALAEQSKAVRQKARCIRQQAWALAEKCRNLRRRSMRIIEYAVALRQWHHQQQLGRATLTEVVQIVGIGSDIGRNQRFPMSVSNTTGGYHLGEDIEVAVPDKNGRPVHWLRVKLRAIDEEGVLFDYLKQSGSVSEMSGWSPFTMARPIEGA